MVVCGLLKPMLHSESFSWKSFEEFHDAFTSCNMAAGTRGADARVGCCSTFRETVSGNFLKRFHQTYRVTQCNFRRSLYRVAVSRERFHHVALALPPCVFLILCYSRLLLVKWWRGRSRPSICRSRKRLTAWCRAAGALPTTPWVHHIHSRLVSTTQVNNAFRAMWLVPHSRNIKWPPGDLRRKKMARETHFIRK